MQKHSKTARATFPDAQLMWNMDLPSIEAVTKTYTAWFDKASRLRDEVMRFAQDRFTKDLEAATQLARCTNPSEALALEAEVATKIAADYLAEGQRIVELMGELAKEVSAGPKAGRAHH
jgi:hypothetical protein